MLLLNCLQTFDLFLDDSTSSQKCKTRTKKYSQNSSSQESTGSCLAASRLQKEKFRANGNQTAPYKMHHVRVSPEGPIKSSEEGLTALGILIHFLHILMWYGIAELHSQWSKSPHTKINLSPSVMLKFILKLLIHTEKLISHAVDSKAPGCPGLDLACRRLMPEILSK